MAAAASSAVLLGCSGSTTDTTSTGPTSGNPTVAIVTVTPPTLALQVGASGTITAQASSAIGSVIAGKTATWTSSNAGIAAVSAGVVLGVSPGNALITATIDGISAVATVSVTSTPPSQAVFASITAGAAHTCALTSAGQAFCWGRNLNGELGDGTQVSRSLPVAVSGGITFASISAGTFYTCGVAASPQGAVYCWGQNATGQLGDGTFAPRLTPTLVKTAGTFVGVSAGTSITCGVASNGVAYCWGTAPYLGNGSMNSSATPTAVSNPSQGVVLSYTSVSVGQTHGCGLTTDRHPYCWGGDPNGALGDGDPQDTTVYLPVAVNGALTLRAFSAAYNGGCGIATDSTTYCWGQQLPQGSGASVPTPLLGGVLFSSLGLGPTGSHGCALTAAGAAYCWGSNSNGQIGDNGPTSKRTTPALVAGGLTWMSLTAGGTHTCGVTTTGLAYCWGNNSDGQLGNDNTVASAPTPVLRPQ